MNNAVLSMKMYNPQNCMMVCICTPVLDSIFSLEEGDIKT